jgi:DNA excision repair protein ERCC-4
MEDGLRSVVSMVKVCVDERERNSGIPEVLKSFGLTIIYKMLDVGDYIINDSLVIERKRVDDLVHSVFDGRFFDQLGKLVEVCDTPLLVVEGDLNDIRYLTSKWRAIEGALITAILGYGVALYYTRDYKHTAEFIKHLAEKIGSESLIVTRRFRKVLKPRGDDIREWQLHIVQSLPGVGIKTAHKLLERFGTVRAVFNASQSELAVVEGISDEKASKIVRILTTPYGKSGKGVIDLSKYIDTTKN